VVDAFIWLAVVELLGVLAFPLAFTLFRRLPDCGYTLTKPLALVLASYLLWILGLTQLVPNSRFTIVGILALGAMIGAWMLYRRNREIRHFLRREWRVLLVAEGVFLGFFVLWLAIVSEVPAINHTEKPMDFGFLNAILQSRYFPPEDPWLAGQPISYYYFGHFMMALLTKLTGLSSAVGYNIAVALVPALLGISAFGLLYNLVRLSGGNLRTGLAFGLVAPGLLILIGNLEGVLEFVHAQGWGSDGFWDWVGIKGLEGATATNPEVFPDQTWWWWRATRVIDTLSDGQSLDYTITEFPFFSFILGDLHPHVMALPFLALFLSLGLNLFVAQERLGWSWLIRHPVEPLAVALVLGALAFINTWDFPVFAVILGAVVFTKSYGDEFDQNPEDGKTALSQAALNTALMTAPIVIVAIALFIPFYRDLSSQASGILPVIEFSTRPFLFFLVMGLFFVLGLSFLLRQLPRLSRPAQQDAPAALLTLLMTLVPFLLWAIIILLISLFTNGIVSGLSEVGERFLLVLPGLAIVGLAGFSALQRARLGKEPVTAFPLLLLAAAFYLLAGAELFFLADFFGNRMNTVFKVYFQSWFLLSVAGAYGLYYWWSHRQSSRLSLRLGQYAWAGLVAALLVVSLYYPVGAVLERTGLLNGNHILENNTLDGLAYLRRSNPAEYAAIIWLRDQAPGGRIVEAVGDDYSEYGRISASTGWPTVLGWKGHEHQWRGSARAFEGREEEVAQIYRTADVDEARRLLEQYDIRYVYVGHRERSRYGADNLSKFDDFMRTAFERDGVIIYERVEEVEQGVHRQGDNGPDPG
jgi:YYY domain-containing protein